MRRGTFGCRTVAGRFELVPGSVLLGYPDDPYVCEHEHAGGDECLSVQLEKALVEELRAPLDTWRRGCVKPLPELMIAGALVQATARGDTELGLDEAGLLLAARLLKVVTGGTATPLPKLAGERRRAVQAALFIEANAQHPLNLERVAAQARCSSFHLLRLFGAVVGVTPHQYLLRCRLRRAAQLLAEESLPITDIALDVGFNDLSNFVRTFHRASGVSPRAFRRASRGARGAVAERLLERTRI